MPRLGRDNSSIIPVRFPGEMVRFLKVGGNPSALVRMLVLEAIAARGALQESPGPELEDRTHDEHGGPEQDNGDHDPGERGGEE